MNKLCGFFRFGGQISFGDQFFEIHDVFNIRNESLKKRKGIQQILEEKGQFEKGLELTCSKLINSRKI